MAIVVKVSKSIVFIVKSFLGNFYRHLAVFSGHTGQWPHHNVVRDAATIDVAKCDAGLGVVHGRTDKYTNTLK